MNTKILGIVIGMSLTALYGLRASQARAANDNDQTPSDPPRGAVSGPPREAVEACANLAEGAACTMAHHGRSVQGKCVKGPDAQQALACMPPPPPEAVEACASLSEGATCTVTHHGRSHEGTCRNSPSGEGPLACAPPRPPRRQ